MGTRRLVLVGLLLLASGAAHADPRIDRLVHLAKLWGTVKLADPYVWSHEVDLDKILIDAIPRVSAAKSADEYRAAVAAMLAAIGDPVTRVPDEREAPGPLPAAEGDFLRVDRGVLLVTLRRWPATRPRPEVTAELTAALDKANAVVFDVRGAAPPARGLFDELGNVFSTHKLVGRAERVVFHSGYRSQDGSGTGGYRTSALLGAAPELPSRKGARARRTVFLVSNEWPVPDIAFALAAAGEGFLVSDGRLIPELEYAVDMGEGVRAVVRTTESIPDIPVDVQVPKGEDAVAAALALAQGKAKRKPVAPRPLPPIVWRPDPTYADTPYPSRELRLLALFRYWNVVHHFYPYLALIGDFDAVLPEMIPRFEAAADELDYDKAVAELMTRVPDCHSILRRSGALADYLGAGTPMVGVRLVEGRPTIVKVPRAGLGVAVGDVILSVDGEPFAKRAERLGRYMSCSSQAIHDQRVAAAILRGPIEKPVKVTVCGPTGDTREVELPREKPQPPPDPPADQVVKILAGNIGYVDLGFLDVADVPAMFDKLKETRAIIFDNRSYPRGTAWAIAPRLNRLHARIAARFERAEMEAGGPRRMTFEQELPPASGPIYDRPTVMLIDDRTQSQAEHTGLFFEAASGTKFIGTPTAGANGDVTTITFPGGLVGWMTGHDVRHADGRQLQRVGLVPDLRVAQTLAGVRAGKDEVLEAAQRFLETSLAVPSRPCASP